MDKMRKAILIFILGWMHVIVFSQNTHKDFKQGDNAYRDNNFEQAQEFYERARTKNNSAKADYNAGNALFQQKNYDKALEKYDGVSKNSFGELKNKALYNSGNALAEKKNNVEALSKYREALRNNPNDAEAQQNYAFLKKQLDAQKQQQNQNRNQQNQQKSGGEQQQKNKPQNKNDAQSNQNKPQPNPSNPSTQQTQQKDLAQQNPPQPRDLKKEEALRALKMLENEERKVQGKQKLGKNPMLRNEKDW